MAKGDGDGDAPAQFTAHIYAGDRWLAVVNDAPVTLVAWVAAQAGQFVAVAGGMGLEDADGNLFTVGLDSLPPEGSGATPAAAQDALIQATRSWLERQDTAGRLAETLGIECLAETAEIVLQFIDPEEADRRQTVWAARRPDTGATVDWDDARPVSIRTLRG